jgi:hypothetical protein
VAEADLILHVRDIAKLAARQPGPGAATSRRVIWALGRFERMFPTATVSEAVG